MSAGFLGINLKTKRARNQFDILAAEINTFLNDEPKAYAIEIEVSPDTLEVFGVFKEKRPPPPMWGVMIGEFVHNLRSALDHLVWQLVILETGAPPTAHTQFPIFLDPAGYKTRGEPVRLAGVGTKAKTLIKSLQPFATREGERSPLWHLHELSNWDKHRDITLVAANGRKPRSGARFGEVVKVFVRAEGPLEHDTVVFGCQLTPSDTPFMDRLPQVEMKGDITIHVTFKQPTMLVGPVEIILSAIGRRVGEVCELVSKEIFH